MKKLLLSFFVLLISITAVAQDARVQVVHNCADDMAAVVDVYVNGLLAAPDVPFRTSSPFADVPTGVPVNVAIAPGDSTSVLDAFYMETFNLEAGETYIIIANGILSPTGYDPSPPFTLDVFDMGREAAIDPSMVDVLVHHGSTDAPVVDAVETGQGLGTVVDDLAYTDYDGYLEFASADYVIELRDASGTNTIATYDAPLQSLGLEGVAVTIVASGFFDPSQNSNGPAFGLYAVSPIGGPMFPLPELLGVTNNTETKLTVYPNPASEQLFLEGVGIEGSLYEVYNVLGQLVISGAIAQNESIDVAKLQAGTYLIKINTNDGKESVLKFNKQ